MWQHCDKVQKRQLWGDLELGHRSRLQGLGTPMGAGPESQADLQQGRTFNTSGGNGRGAVTPLLWLLPDCCFLFLNSGVKIFWEDWWDWLKVYLGFILSALVLRIGIQNVKIKLPRWFGYSRKTNFKMNCKSGAKGHSLFCRPQWKECTAQMDAPDWWAGRFVFPSRLLGNFFWLLA